jgi:hypothetical protein
MLFEGTGTHLALQARPDVDTVQHEYCRTRSTRQNLLVTFLIAEMKGLQAQDG